MKTSREFTTISAYLLLFILPSFCLMCGAYLMCEELPTELCAYSVSSIGARCVLEEKFVRNNEVVYNCQTSSVMGKSSEGWIESDDCMQACGLSRMTVGISTDSLSDTRTLAKLCSARCSDSCPHLFLLHDELAIAESSSSLEDVCKTLNSPHRFMGEFGGLHRDIGDHDGAPKGDHGFFGGDHMFGKDCGLFGCGGGRFALPPQTPTYFNRGGKHFFGGGGPHGRHGWKGRDFDPFFNPFYPPSQNSLPPSSSDFPPSPNSLPPSLDFGPSSAPI